MPSLMVDEFGEDTERRTIGSVSTIDLPRTAVMKANLVAIKLCWVVREVSEKVDAEFGAVRHNTTSPQFELLQCPCARVLGFPVEIHDFCQLIHFRQERLPQKHLVLSRYFRHTGTGIQG